MYGQCQLEQLIQEMFLHLMQQFQEYIQLLLQIH